MPSMNDCRLPEAVSFSFSVFLGLLLCWLLNFRVGGGEERDQGEIGGEDGMKGGTYVHKGIESYDFLACTDCDCFPSFGVRTSVIWLRRRGGSDDLYH